MCKLHKMSISSVAISRYDINNQNKSKFEVNYGTIYDQRW